MAHFGALAAATSCRSPLFAVCHSVPVSPVVEKHWYDALAHLQQPASAASPTGWYSAFDIEHASLFLYYACTYAIIPTQL